MIQAGDLVIVVRCHCKLGEDTLGMIRTVRKIVNWSGHIVHCGRCFEPIAIDGDFVILGRASDDGPPIGWVRKIEPLSKEDECLTDITRLVTV